MFVRDKMTVDPITLYPDDLVSSAVDIFGKNDFHSLPVINNKKEVVGFITDYIVSENVPSKATSLSIHELHYLLNQTKIKDIMLTKVLTIGPDALLEEAADEMLKNDTYALPVVENGSLVGIITQHDIFSAFIETQGYYNKGTRLTVVISEDHPGILKDIANILSAANINISHLVVEHTDVIKIIIRVDETDSDKVVELLKNNYEIVDVRTYK